MMREFEPQKKYKLNKSFYLKYLYVIVLGLVLYFGVSYSLTFFKQNYKVVEGSFNVPSVTINLNSNSNTTSATMNATGLDKDSPLKFIKNITVNNPSSANASIKLTLERTSGIELNNLKYGLFIDGALIEMNDVPANGVILSSTIMANQTENIRVSLWPKSDYAGSETTFVGNLNLEKNMLSLTGSEFINSLTLTENNNYVNFNCNNGTCEKWRIAKVEDNRLVLTTTANYGTNFTNSNLFNTTLVLNDYSLVTSMSTDNKAVYLKKTVEITGGNGTVDNPYTLSNNDYNPNDEKVIATLTYNNDGTTTTQPIFYDKTNYISQVVDTDGFKGWTTTSGGTTADYVLGDTISFTTDTTLYAVIVLSGNVMDTFSNALSNLIANGMITMEQAQNIFGSIVNIKFIDSNTQEYITAASDANSMSVDLTYNNHGQVTATVLNGDLYIASDGPTYLRTGNSLFAGMTNLVTIDFTNARLNRVTDTANMFANDTSLSTIYVTDSWNLSKVQESTNMFYNCTSIRGELGTTYDSNHVNKEYARVDSVNNRGYLRSKRNVMGDLMSPIVLLIQNGTITEENALQLVDSVTEINFENKSQAWIENAIASGEYMTLDLTQSNQGKVTGLYKNGVLTIASDGTTYLSTGRELFTYFVNVTTFNFSNVNTSLVTDMSQMFATYDLRDGERQNLISLDLSGFDTSNVTNMSNMFDGCTNLTNLDLSGFDTSNVTDMGFMFHRCKTLTSINLSGFDTSNVTRMIYMFCSCFALTNLNLTEFDTSNVTDMQDMFRDCSSLTTILVSNQWSTANVTYSTEMFFGCTSLVGGAGTVFDSSIIDKTRAIIDGGTSNPGYLTLSSN